MYGDKSGDRKLLPGKGRRSRVTQRLVQWAAGAPSPGANRQGLATGRLRALVAAFRKREAASPLTVHRNVNTGHLHLQRSFRDGPGSAVALFDTRRSRQRKQ